MKKFFLTLLAILMITSFVFASGNGETSEQTSDGPTHIVMSYLTLGQDPKDLQMVEDALNARSIPEIGVEVEFKAFSAYAGLSLYPQWLSTGERIDLLFPLLFPIGALQSTGLIDPMEDLIKENAPFIQGLTDEGFTFASNNTIDGHIWCVAQIPALTGTSAGFVIYNQYLDEVKAAGLFKEGDDPLYTLDDITEIFALMKKNHPNMYPCGLKTAGLKQSQCLYYDVLLDRLGSDYPIGVVIGTDNSKVVNLYETPEYRDYLDHLREWYLAGYISPDAATKDTDLEAQVAAGTACGFFMSSAPTMSSKDRSTLRTSDYCVGTQPMGGWVIPITAEEPEAAVKFLDYMYSDPSIANLIQWGIEGVHYKVVDADKHLITFADGVDATTSGFYNTLGLYGDMRNVYVWNADTDQALLNSYTEKCQKNPFKSLGFTYLPDDALSAKLAAIQSVTMQYLPSLEAGAVDVDKYLPKMIAELKAAGLDDVIKDEQAKLDAFLEAKN